MIKTPHGPLKKSNSIKAIATILREDLEQQKRILIEYLYSKASAHDWHGVADAAMDIRDINAGLEILDSLYPADIPIVCTHDKN